MSQVKIPIRRCQAIFLNGHSLCEPDKPSVVCHKLQKHSSDPKGDHDFSVSSGQQIQAYLKDISNLSRDLPEKFTILYAESYKGIHDSSLKYICSFFLI